MNNMFSLGSMLNKNSLNKLNFKNDNNSVYKQRLKSGAYEKMAEISPERASFQQSIDKMNDEKGSLIERLAGSAGDMDAITAKLNSGQRLSSGEMEYLKRKNPELYSKAMQIEEERKAYEKQLQNCKTKDEVLRLQTLKLASSMARMKMGQDETMRVRMINDATARFVKSSKYAELPTEAEKNAERKASQAKDKKDKERDDALIAEIKGTKQPTNAKTDSIDSSDIQTHKPDAADTEDIPSVETENSEAEFEPSFEAEKAEAEPAPSSPAPDTGADVRASAPEQSPKHPSADVQHSVKKTPGR